MVAPLSGGAGVGLKLLDSASSSGTTSYRVVLDSPISKVGMTVIHSPTSNGVEVALQGTADTSTGSTGLTLLTRTTGQTSGLTIFTTDPDRPVMQLWATLNTLATTSGATSTGSVDVWIAAVP